MSDLHLGLCMNAAHGFCSTRAWPAFCDPHGSSVLGAAAGPIIIIITITITIISSMLLFVVMLSPDRLMLHMGI